MKFGTLTKLAQLSEDDAQTQAQMLGNELRAERERIGATLRDLQRASGFSLGYLSDLEHGRRWATHDAAWRLEVALTKLAKRGTRWLVRNDDGPGLAEEMEARERG